MLTLVTIIGLFIFILLCYIVITGHMVFFVGVGAAVGMVLLILILNGAFQEEPPELADCTAIVSDNGNKITILFDDFSQSGDVVTIDGYYVLAGHWLDFQGYDYHADKLCLTVPGGVFIFTENSHPRMPSVVDCSEVK